MHARSTLRKCLSQTARTLLTPALQRELGACSHILPSAEAACTPSHPAAFATRGEAPAYYPWPPRQPSGGRGFSSSAAQDRHQGLGKDGAKLIADLQAICKDLGYEQRTSGPPPGEAEGDDEEYEGLPGGWERDLGYHTTEAISFNSAGPRSAWTVEGADDERHVVWFGYDLTGGKVPFVEENALLSQEIKHLMFHLHEVLRFPVQAIAVFFRVREQRVEAILALKRLEYQWEAQQEAAEKAAAEEAAQKAALTAAAAAPEAPPEAGAPEPAAAAAGGEAGAASGGPAAEGKAGAEGGGEQAARPAAGSPTQEGGEAGGPGGARAAEGGRGESRAEAEAAEDGYLSDDDEGVEEFVRAQEAEREATVAELAQMSPQERAEATAEGRAEFEKLSEEEQAEVVLWGWPQPGQELTVREMGWRLEYMMDRIWAADKLLGTGERHVNHHPTFPAFEVAYSKISDASAAEAASEEAGSTGTAGEEEGPPPRVGQPARFQEPDPAEDDERERREERAALREFREKLAYNMGLVGGSIQRKDRSQGKPRKPPGGWSLVVRPARKGSPYKPFVATPEAQRRELTEDEALFLERTKPKPRRKRL